METYYRETWTHKFDFLYIEIAQVIGLGNIWRFPYKCYMYGGGTFLIPYLITVLLCGIPVLLLEMFLGQFSSTGAITVWKFCPILKGVGWAMMLNTIMVTIYYSVIVMYVMYYMIVSLASIGGKLPWHECSPEWASEWCRDDTLQQLDTSTTSYTRPHNITVDQRQPRCMDSLTSNQTVSNTTTVHQLPTRLHHSQTSPEEDYWNRFVLGAHQSTGFDDLGSVQAKNAIYLFIVWIIIFYCCQKGIRSIAKAIYFTATLPVILLVALIVRGLTLDGYAEGIRYYLTPKCEKLSNMSIWQNAATQVLYSIGLALGNHIVYASHNDFNYNLIRDGLILGITNSLVSILGGFVVFMFLGHAAYVMNRPLDTLADTGPGLIFFAYIRGMTYLPASAVWCSLFFLMVFTLGIDSLFGNLWNIYTSLADMWPKYFPRHKKHWTIFILCCLMYLVGLPLTTSGGIHIMVVMDTYAVQISRLVCLFLQCAAICWLYGTKRFLADIEMMIGTGPWTMVFLGYMKHSWKITAPVFSLFILVATCFSFTTPRYNNIDTTTAGNIIGWMMTSAPLVVMVICGVHEVWRQRQITRQNILRVVRASLSPREDWGPRLEEHRTGNYDPTATYITPVHIVHAQQETRF